MIKYGLILKSGRYVEWCDDKWYGTLKEPTYAFKSKKQAEDAFKLMKNHYVWEATLVDTDGNKEEYFNYDKPKKANIFAKSLFTIKIHA